MSIYTLIAVAAGVVGVYLFGSTSATPAPASSITTVEFDVAATPSPSEAPSPAAHVTSGSVAAAVSVLVATPSATPSPTPSPSPQATVIDDCDGKEIHIDESDGDDVHVDVKCNKSVTSGGSISNSVDVNATTGGGGDAGDVTVDINISNKVGGD